MLRGQGMIEIVVFDTSHLVSQKFVATEAAPAKTLEHDMAIDLPCFAGDQTIQPATLRRLTMLVTRTLWVQIGVDPRVLTDAALKLMT